MKKNNITQLIILLLPNILWFTSCYEDKSSFVTNLIPEVQISINDKNQENSIYVGFNLLSILYHLLPKMVLMVLICAMNGL